MANCACTMKRMFAPGHALLPYFLGRVDGLVERLQAGIQVLDVGCGVGGARSAHPARAFPNSTFTGCDTSPTAINVAIADTNKAVLSNISYHVLEANRYQHLPTRFRFDPRLSARYDLSATKLDAIRGCVNDDGVLVIKDIRCSDRDEENLANPLLGCSPQLVHHLLPLFGALL